MYWVPTANLNIQQGLQVLCERRAYLNDRWLERAGAYSPTPQGQSLRWGGEHRDCATELGNRSAPFCIDASIGDGPRFWHAAW